jgi:hypothetical protein
MKSEPPIRHHRAPHGDGKPVDLDRQARMRVKVTSPRYLFLSLVSTGLLALGILGAVHPELLAQVSPELETFAADKWDYLIGGGVIAGVLNVVDLFSRR